MELKGLSGRSEQDRKIQAALNAIKSDVHRTRATVAALAREIGIDIATLYRRMRKRRTGDSLTRKQRSDIGVPKLDAAVELVISSVAQDPLFVNKPIAGIHREIRRLCTKQKLPAPSYSTSHNRINNFKRKGHNTDSCSDRSPRGLTGETVPMQIVRIEFLPISGECEIDSRPTYTFGVSLAVELSSLAILGYALYKDSLAINDVRECLTSALLPKARALRKIGVTGKWPLMGLPSIVHVTLPKILCLSPDPVNRLKHDLSKHGITLDDHVYHFDGVDGAFLENNMQALCSRIRLTARKILGSGRAQMRYLHAAIVEEILKYNDEANTRLGFKPLPTLQRAKRRTANSSTSAQRPNTSRIGVQRLLQIGLAREVSARIWSEGFPIVQIQERFYRGPGLERWWELITPTNRLFSQRILVHQVSYSGPVYFLEPKSDTWIKLSPVTREEDKLLNQIIDYAAAS
jgi:hypothetical protein